MSLEELLTGTLVNICVATLTSEAPPRHELAAMHFLSRLPFRVILILPEPTARRLEAMRAQARVWN